MGTLPKHHPSPLIPIHRSHRPRRNSLPQPNRHLPPRPPRSSRQQRRCQQLQSQSPHALDPLPLCAFESAHRSGCRSRTLRPPAVAVRARSIPRCEPGAVCGYGGGCCSIRRARFDDRAGSCCGWCRGSGARNGCRGAVGSAAVFEDGGGDWAVYDLGCCVAFAV